MSITRQRSLLELSIQSQAGGTNEAVKAALEITDMTSTVVAVSGDLQAQITQLDTTLSQDVYNLDLDLQDQINDLTLSTPTSASFLSDYDARYVNVSGDTMVGDLAIGGQIYSNNIYANNAFGKNALISLVGTNSGNTAFGEDSQKLNSGQGNTTFGSGSLRIATGSDRNTTIGFLTLASCVSGDGNVAIGYQAGYDETGSNKLYIANTLGTSGDALIYGEFDTGKVWIKGNEVDTYVTLGSAPTPTTAGKKGQIGVYSGSAYLWTGDATVVKWTVTESW